LAKGKKENMSKANASAKATACRPKPSFNAKKPVFEPVMVQRIKKA
jgi:hypothetical protein